MSASAAGRRPSARPAPGASAASGPSAAVLDPAVDPAGERKRGRRAGGVTITSGTCTGGVLLERFGAGFHVGVGGVE
eukprot:13263444-Alexandrium_andersonii.AAC.1